MINTTTRLLDILNSRNHVDGLTHNFYHYPARFAPELAREVITEFSSEGDCVLDTFMGGGTTIVEAIAAGRLAIGIDINPLAYFISLVKTTPLSTHDRNAVLNWAEDIINSKDIAVDLTDETDARLRNVPEEIKQFFIYSTLSLSQLEYPRQKRFARCVLIKLGQWALDCRSYSPSLQDMRFQLTKHMGEMLSGLDNFVQITKIQGIPKYKITSRRKLFLGSVNDIIRYKNVHGTFPIPKLILTSPPYPGVHVLYHRWQIKGRRETPAPYWLAGLTDGHGESFYTLGGRSKKGIENYFMQLAKIYRGLRQFIDSKSMVIQLVAFSEPESQLPAFLNAMNHAGYEEIKPFSTMGLERPYREVPNRKWYTQLGQNQSASNEIMLIHRPM